jgi:DNA invertase Pin-like site-specific DNA recombinase
MTHPDKAGSKNIFGQLIEGHMRIHGVGVREVADNIGISSATLSRVMNKKGMSLSTFMIINEWLFGELYEQN